MAYHSTALKQKSPASIMQLNGRSSSSTEKIENLQLLCVVFYVHSHDLNFELKYIFAH